MVETLGEAWNNGWTLRLSCAYGRQEGLKSIRECITRYEPDMMTLLWTRGRDFPLALLQERLRCPMCGSRRVRVAFVPPSQGSSVAARAASVKRMV